MISVETYQSEKAPEWDEFVSQSKNGSFLFLRRYMDYHQARFDDASLIFRNQDKIIAVLPANVAGDSVYSHQGLTFGSLLFSKKIQMTQVLAIFELLKNHYSSLGYTQLYYKKIPAYFSNYPAEEDLYALFRSDAQLYRRDLSSVIDLSSALPFSETKRQNVAKCVAENFEIKEITDFEDFWEMLEKALQKFDTKPVHSLPEIKYLRELFPKEIRLFGVYQKDVLLAGTVIYDFGTVAHTQYMATNEDGRKSGALDFLIYNLVTDVFSTKRFFSFGTSTVAEGTVLNDGLLLQKEMFGARAIVLDHYKLDLISKK